MASLKDTGSRQVREGITGVNSCASGGSDFRGTESESMAKPWKKLWRARVLSQHTFLEPLLCLGCLQDLRYTGEQNRQKSQPTDTFFFFFKLPLSYLKKLNSCKIIHQIMKRCRNKKSNTSFKNISHTIMCVYGLLNNLRLAPY